MVFTSINFLLFFPAVVIIYYLLPKGFRWRFLLLTSLFFYINMQPVYAIILVLISFIVFKFAILIENEKVEKKKERYLILCLILILSPLFIFKYYNFVNESVFSILSFMGLRFELPQITLLLPIGISFYTFMAIGYVVDVYNEEIKPERNLGLVTLFLSFFPLVLSGPIERASSMMSQFRGKLEFNYQKTVNGFQLMLWGYFMKLVVADRVGTYISPILHNIDQHSGSTLFLASLLYPIQVYGDLGGYSLIAIGAANVMGISVRPNFNRPFFATSLSELWRRWHMSLISWILDYVYTPLSFALRRFRMKGILITIVLTLFIMGMWHGASLAFLMWAFYQGIFIGLEALSKNKKFAFEQRYNLGNNVLYIFFSIVITYIIFSFSFLTGGTRHTFSEGILAIKKIFVDSGNLYIDRNTFVYIFLGVSMLFIKDFTDEFYPAKFMFFKNKNKFIRMFSYVSIIVIIILIGTFDGSQFIYFEF